MDISIANRQQRKNVHVKVTVGVYLTGNAMEKITSYVPLGTDTDLLRLAVVYMRSGVMPFLFNI